MVNYGPKLCKRGEVINDKRLATNIVKSGEVVTCPPPQRLSLITLGKLNMTG